MDKTGRILQRRGDLQMQGDFITRIKSAYNQFTKTERKVADFVLDNPRRALFMSITDLAEGCGVGDTSVFRFCKTLELNGYQEFKMLLSLSLNEGNDQLDQFAGKNVTLNDTFEQVSQKVLNANVQTLNETYSLLDEKKFSRAIDLLNSADSIYFFGVGGSMLTAMKAMNKFLRIEPKVRCLPDTHMQAMAASVMGPQDVAVLFSYSGATKDTIHVAELAKQAGAAVICVTRFVKSPLTSYSDVTLLSGANEGPFQSGSTSAEISQMFLIDLLYTEYYRRYFKRCSKYNEKSTASVVEKLV